jgi:1-acyl-sn-glycerol-3-phosphate acyltransferase
MTSDQELAARDLGFIADALPGFAKFLYAYFNTEVRGFERVPEPPVLFVGNHSGGNGSPDAAIFMVSYLDQLGLDRPLYWLAHSLLTGFPAVGGVLRKFGVITARPDAALTALRRGCDIVVYPGGEQELHRPWVARAEVRFGGRTGFLRLARDAGVPIVPFVSYGGHNTYLPIADGHRLAHRLRLDRALRLKVLPVALSAPWGLTVGNFIPHLPFPATIRVEVLDPIDVSSYADLPAAYDAVVDRMQATLDKLAAR